MVPAPGDCTLVIPAYNEERRIGTVLDELEGFPGPVIFVCDGTDRTAETVREYAASRPDLSISCLEYPRRLGKGGGVRAGLSAAKTPCAGFMDADGSTPVREMEQLFSELERHDGAIGSRWVKGADVRVPQSLSRRLQSRLFNIWVKLLFGLSNSDTQCGAKAFTKEALDAVLPLMVSDGFEFDAELLWRLKTAGYDVVEVPITWEDREESSVRTGAGLGMVVRLIRVRTGKQPE